MTEDTKPDDEKRDELAGSKQSKFDAFAYELNKAQIKALSHVPLIGKPLTELNEALCNAGIGVRSLFPVECATTDDVVAELRKQAIPSAKPGPARSGGIRPEA